VTGDDDEGRRRPAVEWVAILLAAGIATALNVITFAAMYVIVAVRLAGLPSQPGLSENTTQVLTGWGGGIIGVLGAYVGYAFGKRRNQADDQDKPDPPP
jgi:hypothetical protein